MSLIIEDEYIQNAQKYILGQSEDIADFISKYCECMWDLLDEGIQEGKTAEALKEFLSQVKSSSKIDGSDCANLGNKGKRLCENYIQKVDKADGDLY